MSNILYNLGKKERLAGTINLTSDTIKIMLLNDTYTPDPDDDYVDDIVAKELVNDEGTGYERKTLANKTFTEDDENDKGIFDADNVLYSAIDTTLDIAVIVIFKDTGNDATSTLILAIDTMTGLPKATNGSDIQLTISNILEI